MKSPRMCALSWRRTRDSQDKTPEIVAERRSFERDTMEEPFQFDPQLAQSTSQLEISSRRTQVLSTEANKTSLRDSSTEVRHLPPNQCGSCTTACALQNTRLSRFPRLQLSGCDGYGPVLRIASQSAVRTTLQIPGWWFIPMGAANHQRQRRPLPCCAWPPSVRTQSDRRLAESGTALPDDDSVGLTESQQTARAIVRLACNPPSGVGEMQRRTANWLLRPCKNCARADALSIAVCKAQMSHMRSPARRPSRAEILWQEYEPIAALAWRVPPLTFNPRIHALD